MAFVPGSPADTESGGAIPLTCAGTPIHWTEQYRYLGFMLRSDLREEEAVKKREHFIEAGFCRTFTHNSSNRSMCEGAKLQMYHVGCLGAANYLGPILPMNPAALRQRDKRVLNHSRQILGLPRNCSSDLVLALSQLPAAEGSIARDKMRFQLQLRLLPYATPIARLLFAALGDERESRRTTQGLHCNWAHGTRRAIAAAVARGAVVDAAAGCWDIARAAHVFGRSLAYISAQDRVRRAHPELQAHSDQPVRLPPNCRGSARHFASLSFGLSKPVQSLGLQHGCTPLSAKGPGCSGWLLAIARKGPYPAYASFLLGNEALHRWPFAAEGRGAAAPPLDPVDDMECGPEDSPPRAPEDYTVRFAQRACPLCGADDLSTFHLVCECTHLVIVEARERALASLATLYSSIRERCRALRGAADADRGPSARADGSRAETVTDLLLDWQALPLSPEGQFLLYWTVAACPWPATAAAAGQPTAQSLGEMFDSVLMRHQLLRPLADLWLCWSESTIKDFAAAWARAATTPHVRSQPPGPGPQGPGGIQ